MDDNNVHTSVVIELANQMDSEGQKLYKIDFNEGNSSKDYVIDQIFCGENVTVYALFEIDDSLGKQYENELVSLTNHAGASGDIRFYQRKRPEILADEKEREIEKDDPKAISRKESFYCLQQCSDEPKLEVIHERSEEMKVLYTKETPVKSPRTEKEWYNAVKTTSRGVNTDIALCPKLLNEVQKVIASSFRSAKKQTTDTRNNNSGPKEMISPKLSSSDLKPNRNSNPSINLGRKSSPNFLLVPLLVTEDGTVKEFKRTEPERPDHGEDGQGDSIKFKKSLSEHHLETSRFSRNELLPKPEKEMYEPNRTELKNLNSYILEEIKSVQFKLNSIIQFLGSTESTDLPTPHPTRSKETVEECKEKHSTEILPTLPENQPSEKQSEPKLVIQDSDRHPQSKEVHKEDLPVCSSSTDRPLVGGAASKKVTGFGSGGSGRIENFPTFSASTASTTSTYTTFSLRNILDNSNSNFKDFEFFEYHDHQERSQVQNPATRFLYKKGRGTLVSKSDSNIRWTQCMNLTQSTLKRCLSLDLPQTKLDALGAKKLKGISFKPDNGLKVKTNARTHSSHVNAFPENLTPNKCEMGDEITLKERSSKPNALDIESSILNGEELFNTLKRDILEMPPTLGCQNEDEGCKQQKSPKNRLTLPPLLFKNEELDVQYSENANGNTDTFLKAGKTPEKTILAKSCRKGAKKSIVEKEKPLSGSFNFGQRAAEVSIKRDVPITKGIKRTTLCRTPEKPVRTEKKDAVFDSGKHKLLYRAVKSVVRANPDSKLHIDKLVKSAVENYTDVKAGRQHLDEKHQVEKNDSLSSRPPSQKRRRDPSTSTTDRSCLSFSRKNSKSSTTDAQKCSLERILENENTDQVLVFDKNIENVIVAKKVGETTNLYAGAEAETGLTKEPFAPVVVELFSKKPQTLTELNSKATAQSSSFDYSSSKVSPDSRKDQMNFTADYETEKAIVKSVWALTKVLLYGDGTKKFEILEASLTPPNQSLKSDTASNSDKSR